MFVRLRDRIAIARKAGADLFMSLHADSIDDKSLRGLSVYTLSETASDDEAAALAASENKVDIIAGIDLSDQAPDRHAVCVALLDALLPMLARFEREGLAPWIEAWNRHDLLAGRAVRVVEGERVHEGVAAGIAADGALRLRGVDGERRCHAGEASLRAA